MLYIINLELHFCLLYNNYCCIFIFVEIITFSREFSFEISFSVLFQISLFLSFVNYFCLMHGSSYWIHLEKFYIYLYGFFFSIGIRQERPAHLHPDSVYQAMRERGRAIPATPTIPIVERKTSPSNPPPRIVEGRVSNNCF